MAVLLKSPAVTEDWIVWAERTFDLPPENHKWRSAIITMLWIGLYRVECGRPFIVPHSQLSNLGLLENGRSGSFVELVVKTLKKVCPDVQCGDWRYVDNKAREIVMPQPIAKGLMAEWKSYVVDHGRKVPCKVVIAETQENKMDRNSSRRKKYIEEEKCARQEFVIETAPIRMRPVLRQLCKPIVDPGLFDRIQQEISIYESLIAQDEFTMRPADTIAPFRERLLSLYRLNHEFGHGESLRLSWEFSKDEFDTGNGYRLYSAASNVPKEVRQNVFYHAAGYMELDLKNAHLAIAAMLLDSDLIASLANDAWDELAKWTKGLACKNQLKRFTYTCLYGGKAHRRICSLVDDDSYEEAELIFNDGGRNRGRSTADTAEHVARHLADKPYWIEAEKVYERLMKHPAIKELISGLAAFCKKLEEESVTDAFGAEVGGPGTRGVTAMAAICSSYEKALLEPIYLDKACGKNYQVVLDQHDGLTIRILGDRMLANGKTLGETTLAHLQDVVLKRARELGINTRLERKA